MGASPAGGILFGCFGAANLVRIALSLSFWPHIRRAVVVYRVSRSMSMNGSRRSFLKTSGAIGAIAAIGGFPA
jgi:hypothetical protein